MPCKRKNRAGQAAPPDILSSLPENVIDHILMRLRLRDAVRTSILSKKWRNTWCRRPEVTLDTTNLISRNRDQFEFADIETLKDDISFSTLILPDVIYHLTTLHPGPITKFTLDIVLPEESNPSMDTLISFLSKNSLQHLHLVFPRPSSSGKQYSLPSSFFTCSQLRYLSLKSCAIQLPPLGFKGFHRLISLDLRSVTISSKLLENIISHSPCLEKLTLCQISMDVHVVEIYAPTLRSFKFGGSLRSICLKNVPRLVKLKLYYVAAEYFLKAARDCHIAKFFESCSALEHLQLFDTFSSLGAVEVPSRFPFVLYSVKRLFVFDFTWIQVAYAFCWIRSFPHLQFLDIKATKACDDDRLLEVERHSDITFKHLREVNSKFDEGAVHAIEFMKLLLLKSPMLERMCIRLREPLEESARVEMLDGLSKCKPASPKAEVDVILRDHESYRVSFV